MLTGYNTDFKFQGKIYHAQTEDGGANNPVITTLLYYQGEILASRRTSYEDILKADCLDEVVRDLMKEQHKQLIRDLMHGNLDLTKAQHQVTPAPKAEPVKEAPPAAKPTPPPSSPLPQKPVEDVQEKSLDDIILEFLAQEQREREQKRE
jgi:hypothetical protein